MNAANESPGLHAACVALIALSCSIAPACTAPDARTDAPVETSPSAVTATADNAAVPGTVESGSAPAPPLPRLASGVMPVYPRMSRRLGEEGWVEVVIDVREDGEVLGYSIAASSGSPRLDEAVLAAARTWRFLPRTGARGVDHMRHRIVFQLTKK